MSQIKQQQGMSPVSILFIICLVVGMAFVSLKLIPVYLEHFSVVSSLNSMKEEVGMRGQSSNELMKLLMRRLEINDVKRVTPDNITIKRQPKETTIRVFYEVQIPIVANLDFLLTFDNIATLN